MENSKGVAHAGKSVGMSSGEADENERKKNDKKEKGKKMAWDEQTYRAKNRKPFNNYDWSRARLNFEVTRGADGKPKVIPLGSQPMTLYKRYQKLLQDIGYKQYKTGASNQQLTYVGLILSGSTERMQKIAFGDQTVDYERNPDQWKNWNVTRTEAIEEWALDVYKFVCEKYGEENIIGFEVHLDETEPHVHCNIVPTAIMQQRGQVGGYIKIDKDGNDVRYAKGKHVGELVKLNKAKYDKLSDEKKKEYRPNVRGTVRTISYATHFGSTNRERSEKMSQLHTDFYEKVGKKWGFERGDVWADLSEEERRKRRRRTKEEAYLEKEAKKAKEKAVKEQADAEAKASEQKAIVDNNAKTIKEQDAIIDNNKQEIQRNRTTLLNQQIIIGRKGEELQKMSAETAQAKKDTEIAKEVSRQAESKANEQKMVVAANEETISRQKEEIENNSGYIGYQDDIIKQNDSTIEKQQSTLAEAQEKHDSLVQEAEQATEKLSTANKELEKWGAVVFDEKLIEYPSLTTMTTADGITFRQLLDSKVQALVDVLNTPIGVTERHKNWKTDRLLEAKAIVTELEEALFGADGIDKAHKNAILQLGKDLYKEAKSMIIQTIKENVRLKKENQDLKDRNQTLGRENSQLKQENKQLRFDKDVDKTANNLLEEELKKEKMAFAKNGNPITWTSGSRKGQQLTKKEYIEYLEVRFEKKEKELKEEKIAREQERQENKNEWVAHKRHMRELKNLIWATLTLDLRKVVKIIIDHWKAELKDFKRDIFNELKSLIFGAASTVDERKIYVSKAFVWAQVYAELETDETWKPVSAKLEPLKQDAVRIADGTWEKYHGNQKLEDAAVQAVASLANSPNPKHYDESDIEAVHKYLKTVPDDERDAAIGRLRDRADDEYDIKYTSWLDNVIKKIEHNTLGNGYGLGGR